MPIVLLLALGVVAGWAFWKSAHKYPAFNPTADALTLLNFQPFTVQQGQEVYLLLLTRENLTPAMITNKYKAADATPLRKHIPLPSPTTVPSFADLWGVHLRWVDPTQTFSPASVLKLYTNGVGTGSPQRDLAALLAVSALSPSSADVLAVPIAGKAA